MEVHMMPKYSKPAMVMLIALLAITAVASLSVAQPSGSIPDSLSGPAAPGSSLFSPGNSLFFGFLGIFVWIWSKPEGQKLLAVWGWVKDHAKDTVFAFLCWVLVWLMWLGLITYTGDFKWLQMLKEIFPSKIGPFAIPIAISSSSLVNHIVGQIEERAKRALR